MLRASVVLAILAAFSQPRNADATGQLRVAFRWKRLEYDWPNGTRELFPLYEQDDNLPLGLEVTDDRVFVTVPRWRKGVAASLNYIWRNDTSDSPKLKPYPSWEAHRYGESSVPEVVSTFRIRADRCDRLWVLDTGVADILGTPEQQAPPSLLVYDLTSNELLRKYVVPKTQRTADSLFANIAVEDQSCDDAYVYLGDLAGPGLVVYSWKYDRSWLVKHHYFHPDPQGGEFNVSGIAFQWSDGIFGMALVPTKDGFSTLYFHPLSSTLEFAVSTKLLRDQERATSAESFNEFRKLGDRGKNKQSSVSAYDPKTGVLFYALTNYNALACWRVEENYDVRQQGVVFADNITMVFPNDLKIDRDSNIWILTDRLPAFMYSKLDYDDYNFRILTGSAVELTSDMVCQGMESTTKMAMSTTPTSATSTSTARPKYDVPSNEIIGNSVASPAKGSAASLRSPTSALAALALPILRSVLS